MGVYNRIVNQPGFIDPGPLDCTLWKPGQGMSVTSHWRIININYKRTSACPWKASFPTQIIMFVGEITFLFLEKAPVFNGVNSLVCQPGYTCLVDIRKKKGTRSSPSQPMPGILWYAPLSGHRRAHLSSNGSEKTFKKSKGLKAHP